MSEYLRQKTEVCNPLLSIVIPVYNVEPYLVRCMKSVMEQTYHALEIILVDDGSTDRSGIMCDRYQAEDARVKVIHKENGGLVSARKAGLREASGEYIAYVDSDDWIEPDMYLELISIMRKLNPDVVTSGLIRDYGTHCVMQPERMQSGFYEKDDLSEKFLKKMISTEAFFKSNVIFSSCNKVYKTERLIQWQSHISDFVNVGEDVALTYQVFLNASKVAVSGNNYYHYCIREDSIVGRKREDEWLRYQVLFSELKMQCLMHKERVSNIMQQINLHEFHLMLLQHSDKMIHYQDGVLFPFGELKKHDRVVIYGAGKFGCELKRLLERTFDFRIAAWIDKAAKSETQTIDCLKKIQYDKIIIAVLVADVAEEIKKELINHKIEEEKILQVSMKLLENMETYECGEQCERSNDDV